MELEKLFDLLCHRYENPEEDYRLNKKITLKPKQQGVVIRKSVQAFMQDVASPISEKVAIQAFSGSSDLPQLSKDVFNVTERMPEFDTFWQLAFRGIPLMRGQLEWQIADVESGVTFELVPEAQRVKIYGVSGTVQTVGIAKYGAGIGVTWEMVEGRKLYQFVNQLEQARAALNTLWADTHYGLLATAAANNQRAWAASGNNLARDIATLNAGYLDIGEAVKDKGYGTTAASPMLLFVNPKLRGRINQALRATSSDIVVGRGSSGPVDILEYPIVPYYSWNSKIPANKGLLVLPGNKIQNSVYMRELGLSRQDIEALTNIQTYWTAFGAIVADNQQCVELAFS